jgi:thioredoxin-dependent peroxiredoxin
MIKKYVLVILVIIAGLICGCNEKQDTNERKGLVTVKGNPVTLIGNEVKVGDKAMDFEVIANDLSTVKFSSFKGKVCIITSLPSLDTPVCDTMTHKFNEQAMQLGPDVVILAISMDLPFAQKRWCGSAGIKNVETLSDYRWASFGQSYGVLIKELRLLARAVFVIDKDGTIKYIQIVKDTGTEPDYLSVLEAVKKLLPSRVS